MKPIDGLVLKKTDSFIDQLEMRDGKYIACIKINRVLVHLPGTVYLINMSGTRTYISKEINYYTFTDDDGRNCTLVSMGMDDNKSQIPKEWMPKHSDYAYIGIKCKECGKVKRRSQFYSNLQRCIECSHAKREASNSERVRLLHESREAARREMEKEDKDELDLPNPFHEKPVIIYDHETEKLKVELDALRAHDAIFDSMLREMREIKRGMNPRRVD